MVSFQCEACGDVFTKKKLEPHRNNCHGASFSCLDCMEHFKGTEYRAHTSCITEAQKYQGNLYKEKPKNPKRKSVTIAPDPVTLKPRAPYVEDAPDADDTKPTKSSGDGESPPPPAPSPPPLPRTPTVSAGNKPDQPLNVFDFLDSSGTPTSATHPSTAPPSEKPMKMVTHAPSIFDAPKHLVRIGNARDEDIQDYDLAYEENGFSYGSGPIPPATLYDEPSNISMEFTTPAPKNSKKDRRRVEADQEPPSLEHSRTNSLTGTGDKKRKRGQPENLLLSRHEEDVTMTDVSSGVPTTTQKSLATPTLNHSGLTGGLSQMMRTYSPSPEYRSDGETYTHHPISPIKRTRRGNNNNNNKDTNGHADNGLGISIKGGAGRLISLLGSATGVTPLNGTSNDPSKALVRTRRHSSSDGENEKARKAVRKQKHRDERRKRHLSTALVPVNGNKSDSDDSDSGRPRQLKAIEYRRRTDSDDRSRSPQGTKSHKGRRDKNHKSNGHNNNQLILYKHSDSDEPTAAEEQRRERASQFLSLVNKGPESERGLSIHKTLKRFRRECSSSSLGSEERDTKGGDRGRERGRGGRRDHKGDEEQDLWRMLRLKRNDRGEIVLFL